MCWIGGMCWGRWGGGVGSEVFWYSLELDLDLSALVGPGLFE